MGENSEGFRPTPNDSTSGAIHMTEKFKIDELHDRCADILCSRSRSAGVGYKAARAKLLMLSEGRSHLSVLSQRHFESFSTAVIPLGQSHFHLTRFESETDCETVSIRGDADRYVFHIPLKGALEISIDQRRLSVRPGEMAIATHAGKIRKAWTGSKDTLNYVVERTFLQEIVGSTLGGNRSHRVKFPEVVPLHDDPALLELIQHIIHQARPAGLAGSGAMGRQFGILLVSALLTRLPHTQQRALSERGRRAPAPAFVMRFERWVAANLSEPFNPQALAKQAGVSVRTLYSGVKRVRGETPYEYILNQRLNRAREILSSEDRGKLRINALALYLGFRSPSHFSRLYRQRFGETPREMMDHDASG